MEVDSIYVDSRFDSIHSSASAGGETGGGARAPPEIFRFELNSATKVEFCLLKWQLSMEATVS